MMLFALLLVALFFAASVSATCDSYGSKTSCESNSCSWCLSSAVKPACYSPDDAHSLPSSIFDCSYPAVALKETACDSIKKEADCMKAKSGSENCSWCNSAAVGGTCFIESDAKSLPSSVFQCKYQAAVLKGTTCDGITSEKTCMASNANGVKCSWCKSGAVGATCFTETDAKSLPSSVFQCEYQNAYAGLRKN